MGSVDFLNKIIGILIAVALLVIGPLTTLMSVKVLAVERGCLNDMEALIDKVSDTGNLTANELADFKLAIASHGIVADIKIERYITLIVPDGAGGTKRVLQLHDDISSYNRGDYISVTVKAVDMSGTQKLLYRLTSFLVPPFNRTLTGRVRN